MSEVVRRGAENGVELRMGRRLVVVIGACAGGILLSAILSGVIMSSSDRRVKQVGCGRGDNGKAR